MRARLLDDVVTGTVDDGFAASSDEEFLSRRERAGILGEGCDLRGGRGGDVVRAEGDEVEKPVGDRADAGVEEDFGDERGLGERHGDERLAESAKGDDVL